jgi:hypothetical protein
VATSGRHAARCLHVGAGFQPAHESPLAWTPRRLKTCGHFGQPAATSGRHAARCLHVGAGFQPAHEPPRAWTPRRLKTCGHFGQPAATSGRHAARCLHVGAGFQPAHEPPWAWTPRRLKTCGHFGQPVAPQNAAADGTLVDAARGQALASRSSCHRVFRPRSPFEPGPGFVRGQGYPALVAVTFFTTPGRCGGSAADRHRLKPALRRNAKRAASPFLIIPACSPFGYSAVP